MRIHNENILQSATQDLTSSVNFRPIWIGHSALYAIQLTFTGTLGGSFKLQASCDAGNTNNQTLSSQPSGVVNWTDVANSTQNINAAGNVMWNVADPGYCWVRVVWTASSGAGTLTVARCNIKGV